MVTKLLSNDNNNNSFKLQLYYVYFLKIKDIKYMKILTRQRRGRLVLDHYNQGKTMHTTGIDGNIKVVRIRNSLDSCR
jgi:hypothetical protein